MLPNPGFPRPVCVRLSGGFSPIWTSDVNSVLVPHPVFPGRGSDPAVGGGTDQIIPCASHWSRTAIRPENIGTRTRMPVGITGRNVAGNDPVVTGFIRLFDGIRNTDDF